MGRRAERRVHVRVPARAARARAAQLHRDAAARRRIRRRARRFQRDLVDAAIPTSRRSTCAKCSRRSRAWSTTSPSRSRSSARVALASGALILIGAVAMTKFQRVYEAAILRTLGASTRLLGTMLALEYSALGLIAGLVGAAGALALSWAVCRFVFEIDWRRRRCCWRRAPLATTVLVGIIGVVASADVLQEEAAGDAESRIGLRAADRRPEQLSGVKLPFWWERRGPPSEACATCRAAGSGTWTCPRSRRRSSESEGRFCPRAAASSR